MFVHVVDIRFGANHFFSVSLIFFYQFQDNNTNGEETSDASFQPLEESHPVEVTPNSQKRAAFSET